MPGTITAVQTGSGWDVDQTGTANLQGDLQPNGSIVLNAQAAAAVAAALGGLPGVVRTGMSTTAASTAGQIVGNSFDPSAAPLQFEKDVLFAPMWSSDADAIRDGVRFSRNFLGYWADANRGTLLAASSTKWKLGCGMAGQGTSVEPIVMQADGILPADEFTISFWLKSVGADFTTVTHGATLFRYQNYVGGYVTEGFRIDHNWEGQLEAQFYSSNSSSPWSNTYRVNLVLATGDIPADTWVPVTVVYKRSAAGDASNPQLQMFIGNGSGTTGNKYTSLNALGPNQLQMTPTNAMVENDPYGVYFMQNAPTALQISDFVILRNARVANQAAIKSPIRFSEAAITVDAGTTVGTINQDIFGIACSYKGFSMKTVDGDATMRKTVFSTMYEAGARTTRMQICLNRVTMSGTYPNFTYDWTPLTAAMDDLKSLGFELYLCIYGTPALLSGSGASVSAVPTNNTSYAKLVVDFIAMCNANGYNISGISFWNEPADGFWGGTVAQLSALYIAVAQAVQAAYPAAQYPQYVINPPSETRGINWDDAGNTYATILPAAQSAGIPITAADFHDYSGSLAPLQAYVSYNTLDTNRVSMPVKLAQYGYGSAALWVSEWGFDHLWSMSLCGNATNQLQSFGRTQPPFDSSSLVAAHAGAYLCTLVSLPSVTMAAHYTMQQTDPNYNGEYGISSGEQAWGLLTLDNPPRARPNFPVFWMAWRAANSMGVAPSRLSCSTNWPTLRAFATKDNSGAIRLFYSTYRRYRNTGTSQHQFKWSNLPANFAWKHWQFDHTKLGDMRPTLVGSGDQTNLPLGTSMGVCGVGLIEIVPA